MTDELYGWLRREFYYSNHSKYRHLFEEWIKNITSDQIEGFSRQMYRKKHNVLGIFSDK